MRGTRGLSTTSCGSATGIPRASGDYVIFRTPTTSPDAWMALEERPNLSVKFQPGPLDRSTGSHDAYPTTSPPHTARTPGVRGPDALRLHPQGSVRDLPDL